METTIYFFYDMKDYGVFREIVDEVLSNDCFRIPNPPENSDLKVMVKKYIIPEKRFEFATSFIPLNASLVTGAKVPYQESRSQYGLVRFWHSKEDYLNFNPQADLTLEGKVRNPKLYKYKERAY